MPVLLFVVALVGSCVILWGIFYTLQRNKGREDLKEQFEKARIKLFGYIRQSSSAILKIVIITELEIDPRYLKKLIKSLTDDGFITESLHTVKITKFGEQYYDKFIHISG